MLVQPTTTNQPWPLDLLYHRYMTLNLTLDLKTVLLQTSSKKSSGHVKIAHLNIRLLKCCEHRVLVKEGVLENKFDIFTISETWLNNSGTEWKQEFLATLCTVLTARQTLAVEYVLCFAKL